ncbi:MAG: hypothetical protein NDI69_03240 [Bacteriovoracaceae bacterium]|nr:hypothetical protein [Bacteriovoracaceae bacterium]
MEFSNMANHNPIEHARNIEDILASLKSLCRKEKDVFNDPKAKALLETSAEVLGGLEKAFHDYQQKNDAWKDEYQETPQQSSDPWD